MSLYKTMENPHLENLLDPPQEITELKNIWRTINWNYWGERGPATCGRTKDSCSLQTWKMKQPWSKFTKSWKARRAFSLILASRNCLCWRNISAVYPGKRRLRVCYSGSQAAVCSYQVYFQARFSQDWISTKWRNIKTMEAKTVCRLCVEILPCFTPIPNYLSFSPFRRGSLQLFSLPASSFTLFNWTSHTLYSFAHGYGCSLDLISDWPLLRHASLSASEIPSGHLSSCWWVI